MLSLLLAMLQGSLWTRVEKSISMRPPMQFFKIITLCDLSWATCNRTTFAEQLPYVAPGGFVQKAATSGNK